ncbi:MAG: hypothetical protein ACO1NX_03795 [Chitinophagaceae bacterium]
MKQRKPKLIAAALFLFFNAEAQFKLPVSNAFRSDVQKVVASFPGQFSDVRGEVIQKNPQTVEYASLVRPDKAVHAVVTQYSSNSKEVYTWHATLLSTEDYAAAEKKYKWLYAQLQGMNVKYVVDQYTLRGAYREPSDGLDFVISELSVFNPPMALKKLRVEVAMQFEFPEWKVGLTIFEKEKEDDEPGYMTD